MCVNWVALVWFRFIEGDVRSFMNTVQGFWHFSSIFEVISSTKLILMCQGIATLTYCITKWCSVNNIWRIIYFIRDISWKIMTEILMLANNAIVSVLFTLKMFSTVPFRDEYLQSKFIGCFPLPQWTSNFNQYCPSSAQNCFWVCDDLRLPLAAFSARSGCLCGQMTERWLSFMFLLKTFEIQFKRHPLICRFLKEHFQSVSLHHWILIFFQI